jgi:hypothetical protein
MKKILIPIFALLVSFSTFASKDMIGTEMKPNSDFEKMKSLVGKWTGTGKDEKGNEQKIPLTYELVSGGTAIMERLSPEGHEMVTMYYVDGNHLKMTHYCAVGNQPEMKLNKKDATSFSFDFVRGSNIPNKNSPHMNDLKITWVSPNEIEQVWTFYKDGKPMGDNTVFRFKRE